SVHKINSLFSSCFKLAIITDIARLSLRDFFHAQIGQKRFLHVFPLCCFFFSILSSATIIMNVLHSFTSSNIFSEIRFSDTSRSEERRVGKECRSRWSAEAEKTTTKQKRVRSEWREAV